VRLIDRLIHYLDSKKITAYAFEKACGVANGYLGKQAKGKGSVGSDILEKISTQYPDLNLSWLITGKGKMIVPTSKSNDADDTASELKEGESVYAARDKLITLLKEQLAILESSLPAKRKKRVSKKKKRS
jgi:hypothetical protein